MSGDTFSRAGEAFVQWFLSDPQANISPKISLTGFRDRSTARGIVAKENIEGDAELFTVPRSSILCVENSDLRQKSPSVFEETDNWSSLILVMLYEFLRGDRSPWKLYFDVLPDKFDSLMFWSENELAELQGSAVIHKIGKTQADEMFRSKILPIIQSRPEIFEISTSTTGHSEESILALAHRMGSTIMAYAFDLEKDEAEQEGDEDGFLSEEEDEELPKGLIPVADMLNADPENYNAQLFYGKDTLTMKALKPISKGEEILVDNGPLPRSDLLRRYGYITDSHAKYDVVEVALDMVAAIAATEAGLSDEDRTHRLQYFEEQDFLDDGYDISYPDEVSPAFAPELLGLINGLLLPPERFNAMRSRESLPKEKMTSAVANVLSSIIERRQSDYGTSIEEDETLLQSQVTESRLKMAIEVRLGEKKVMETALKALRQFSAGCEHPNPSSGGKRAAHGDDLATPKKSRPL
ncbi:SET domain-containing protein [Xylona heveae TC161]|uniref:Ribosomal lysine N-methyltransferase 4 n=1 Tax=Xylona heveae (strain CBS 132557 / TC161) TaxID=1328760 RepID=A0A165GW03_XYLHT|nr:SET domain-containing protein [Xylona heveae TC161]KZF22667.1 SET domain-containing protein [Xylona heveae TC161]